MTLVMPRVLLSVLTQVPMKSAGAAIAGFVRARVARVAVIARVVFNIFRFSPGEGDDWYVV